MWRIAMEEILRMWDNEMFLGVGITTGVFRADAFVRFGEWTTWSSPKAIRFGRRPIHL